MQIGLNEAEGREIAYRTRKEILQRLPINALPLISYAAVCPFLLCKNFKIF